MFFRYEVLGSISIRNWILWARRLECVVMHCIIMQTIAPSCIEIFFVIVQSVKVLCFVMQTVVLRCNALVYVMQEHEYRPMLK